MLIFSREEGGNSQEPELHDIRDLVQHTAVHARVSNYNYNYVFTRIDCYGRMTVRATLHMNTWDRAVKKTCFHIKMCQIPSYVSVAQNLVNQLYAILWEWSFKYITCNINHSFYSVSDTIPIRSVLQTIKNLLFLLQIKQFHEASVIFLYF